jgi:hypothetical protein
VRPQPPRSSGASRQACHAGGHAGRATRSRTVRDFQTPSAAKTGGVARRTARSTSSRRRPQVEQAARLAMPAVTPAERHDPERYGSSKRHPARRTARSLQAAALKWSKPPGLPCRRSRRQSDTIPNGTGVPNAIRRQDWRRGTQDCALHLKPPRSSGASRQACHAGGRAGRGTQPRAVRAFQTPSGPHDCALHLKPPRPVGAAQRVRPSFPPACPRATNP